MPLLTERKKIEEYKKIVDYLNELEIPSKVAKEGEILEEACMVFYLPDFTDNSQSASIYPENTSSSRFATGVITQMDERSEEQLTKYLNISVVENITNNIFEEDVLLKILNRLNQAVRVGNFFYEEDKSVFPKKKLVKYRYQIPASTMKDFDIAVICESIVEVGLGFDLLIKSLTVL